MLPGKILFFCQAGIHLHNNKRKPMDIAIKKDEEPVYATLQKNFKHVVPSERRQTHKAMDPMILFL